MVEKCSIQMDNYIFIDEKKIETESQSQWKEKNEDTDPVKWMDFLIDYKKQ